MLLAQLILPEIDNPDALSKYYRLLLSVVRVVTSVVLSHGSQNKQSIDQARSFLVDNRPTVLAVFKRQSKVGGRLPIDASANIDELVELFVLLITVTGFLEVRLTFFIVFIIANIKLKYEERRDSQGSRKFGFA